MDETAAHPLVRFVVAASNNMQSALARRQVPKRNINHRKYLERHLLASKVNTKCVARRSRPLRNSKINHNISGGSGSRNNKWISNNEVSESKGFSELNLTNNSCSPNLSQNSCNTTISTVHGVNWANGNYQNTGNSFNHTIPRTINTPHNEAYNADNYITLQDHRALPSTVSYEMLPAPKPRGDVSLHDDHGFHKYCFADDDCFNNANYDSVPNNVDEKQFTSGLMDVFGTQKEPERVYDDMSGAIVNHESLDCSIFLPGETVSNNIINPEYSTALNQTHHPGPYSNQLQINQPNYEHVINVSSSFPPISPIAVASPSGSLSFDDNVDDILFDLCDSTTFQPQLLLDESTGSADVTGVDTLELFNTFDDTFNSNNSSCNGFCQDLFTDNSKLPPFASFL